MIRYLAKCADGQGTLAEALFGVMILGGFLVACALLLGVQATGFLAGSELGAVAWRAAEAVYCAFSLFAAYCIWRCAFNFRYRAVGIVVRAMVAISALAFLAQIVRLLTGQFSPD